MNELPWINSYPPGVRWDKEITPAPLQTILDHTVAKWPDRPAIDFMGKRLSYRELGDYVSRCMRAAAAWREAGRARRPVPSEYTALHHCVLRGAEGRRNGGQLLAARCRSSFGA